MRPNVGDWTYVEDGLPEYGEAVYAACRAKDRSRDNWVADVPFFGFSRCCKNKWGIPIIDNPVYEVYAWIPKWWPKAPKERILP